MEFMARLALIEQGVRDGDKFIKILYEILRHINYILENPHDYEIRTIKSDIIEEALKYEDFRQYVQYLGFQTASSNIVYPKEHSLSNLRIAQATIERKITVCCGTIHEDLTILKPSTSQVLLKKDVLKPVQLRNTSNQFLIKLASLFNHVLVYEDEELQALAREHIPITTLQLRALGRVRDQQRKLKTGELKDTDLPFDVALLMELLCWFKHEFFKWVDKPDCNQCGAPTQIVGMEKMTDEHETCNVEVYKCTSCAGGARFPRHNAPHTLLRSRRGRCGEWANCFALLCRSLGYDTRHVYDTTDHVWCEIYDYDSQTWLHADPCEAQLNAPLLYEHGWGKKLSYVIAASRDDLQDVTWRYTMNHKEVLKRRKLCSEQELIAALMELRGSRQSGVSAARRRYLARRTLQELSQLLVERKPSDYESQGRMSGSVQWRLERGELGGAGGHQFQLGAPGTHTLRYYPAQDRYTFTLEGPLGDDTPRAVPPQDVAPWSAGVFHAKGVSRKVEHDWKMTYLARTEGESVGEVSWKLSAAPLAISRLQVSLRSALVGSGRAVWTVAYDDGSPELVGLGENPWTASRRCQSVTFSVTLSGGDGREAWQHAQLFRSALHDETPGFEVIATVEEQ